MLEIEPMEPNQTKLDQVEPGVRCHLDRLLQERNMTLTRLSELVDVSIVNLSILKNNRARAIRFSTLVAICHALNCEVGELLSLDNSEVGYT